MKPSRVGNDEIKHKTETIMMMFTTRLMTSDAAETNARGKITSAVPTDEMLQLHK
jgi:hypothetical protein